MEEFVLRAQRAYEPPEASLLLFTFSSPHRSDDCTCYCEATAPFALRRQRCERAREEETGHFIPEQFRQPQLGVEEEHAWLK